MGIVFYNALTRNYPKNLVYICKVHFQPASCTIIIMTFSWKNISDCFVVFACNEKKLILLYEVDSSLIIFVCQNIRNALVVSPALGRASFSFGTYVDIL
jgi:hypothetical protein